MNDLQLRIRGMSCGLLTALLVLGGGCEWEGSGDGDFWSEQYEFLNFSGVYRPASGSSIILSYEAAGDVDSGTGIGVIDEESIGTGDGVSTTFSGVLSNRPVISGSLNITAGGFNLVDLGDGTLADNGVTGTIDYGTGAWSINLAGQPLNAGANIRASYQFSATGGGTGSTPGSSKPIYQFNVQQTGNHVTLIDNYGQRYSGKLASVDTVSEGEMVDQRQDINQSFSFTAEGEADGMPVRIVGSFIAQQTVYYLQDEDGALTENYRIASFLLEGTWIEPSGQTGRIDATGPADQRIQISQ